MHVLIAEEFQSVLAVSSLYCILPDARTKSSLRRVILFADVSCTCKLVCYMHIISSHYVASYYMSESFSILNKGLTTS